jgi:site-specific recombinase XerD
MTVLRQRMVEDMRLRGLSARTQEAYVRAVRQLAEHYHRSPDLIKEEEIRQYFLYLIHLKKLARASITIALCGIKFFYEHTVKRDWKIFGIVRPPKEKRLPIVLSRDEVRRVLRCVRIDVYRVCLTTIYACGLRLREGTELQVSQVDGGRGQLNIIGKGNKQRTVPLSPPTLEMLREFWRTHRSPRWLFPARTRQGIEYSVANDCGPVHFGSVQAALRQAVKDSGLGKPVSVRALRHSYATHLLESGVNLRLIQVYLGHSSPQTTAIYTHLTREVTEAAKDPIERLMDGL